jgi:hypothetical protein
MGVRTRDMIVVTKKLDATKPYHFIGFVAMDATKPYQFIRFGALDATKPYKFISFPSMPFTLHPSVPLLHPLSLARRTQPAARATLPFPLWIAIEPLADRGRDNTNKHNKYKHPRTPNLMNFIGFGAMDATKPYKFIGFGLWKPPNPINL